MHIYVYCFLLNTKDTRNFLKFVVQSYTKKLTLSIFIFNFKVTYIHTQFTFCKCQ